MPRIMRGIFTAKIKIKKARASSIRDALAFIYCFVLFVNNDY